MSIGRKVRQVKRLFGQLEKEIEVFKSASGLHCIKGCGRCCNKPDIEASPLEFLPWAFHTFLQGQSEKVLDELSNENSTFCYLYKPLSIANSNDGSCGNYNYRGLICRLFAYGANRDKMGQLRLITCKIIKEDQQTQYMATIEALKRGLKVPVFIILNCCK